jgi:hypothetical protein
MQAWMGFVVFVSMIGLVVGLIMCIPKSKRQSGKLIAGGSFAVFAMCIVAAAIKGPAAATVTNPVAQPVQTAAVVPAPRKLTKSDMIGQFRIRALSWEKDGFGTIMIASFTIHNDNTVPVKDVKITCSSSGFSDTTIDTNTCTVYDVIGPRSFGQISKMNMGFIRGEVADTKCKVVDFSAA